jgi:hypothetical protein
VKPSLRATLVESHVAAVAISIFLLWSLDWAFSALWAVLVPTAEFVLTAIAIRGVPYWSGAENWVALLETSSYLSGAIASWSAAWLLSRWAFGVSPLKCLRIYRSRITGSIHA